ncbi:MAG TPA: SRPBCC family protein [Actinomycetota bacterium]|nr:SRPBCC family protein [Actinomycetota bacterium]
MFIVTRIDIRRPAEAVWPYLVDWEGLPRWMHDARDVRVTGTREGVGAEAMATIRIGGITTTDPIRVTRWDPPAILEIEHRGWVKGSGYMELSPTEDGCQLFWREELRPPWGVLGRIGLVLYRPILKRTFQKDIERLKRLAESARR